MSAIADKVPDYIECVTICAHPEEAGQTNAIKLADALMTRGFEVILHGLPS
jgi:hypothetical protein